jgi:hypothetical protein
MLFEKVCYLTKACYCISQDVLPSEGVLYLKACVGEKSKEFSHPCSIHILALYHLSVGE